MSKKQSKSKKNDVLPEPKVVLKSSQQITLEIRMEDLETQRKEKEKLENRGLMSVAWISIGVCVFILF